MSKSNILILMSGSIASYKACTVISQLKQKNYNLKVVMSEAAQKMIGTTTIEGLLGEPPITDMYAKNSVMDHINLARWADLIITVPATANTINKFAAGLGDDLMTTLFLAHDFSKPFLVTPAMNTKMYQHPTTAKSIKQLKDMGVQILETASGVLACGEIGSGKLLDPELIIKEIENALTNTSAQTVNAQPRNEVKFKNKSVLITSGGTQEKIDDVRVLTNKSTGKTAAYIADQFTEAGFSVTYVHATSAKLPMLDCQRVSFTTFKDLQTILTTELTKNYDMVVHAAAVSDYSPIHTDTGKIDSSSEILTLQLQRNPKLIDLIKKLSPQTFLVGFKLTSNTNENAIHEKVLQLFNRSGCDMVVQNDWSTIQEQKHVFNLNTQNNKKTNLDLETLSIELVLTLLKKAGES